MTFVILDASDAWMGMREGCIFPKVRDALRKVPKKEGPLPRFGYPQFYRLAKSRDFEDNEKDRQT